MNRYLVICVLFSLCFGRDLFEHSSFPKRSGDVIVVPENIQDDSFLLLLDSSNVQKSNEGQKIEETNFANLISNIVGGPIINTEVLNGGVASGRSLFNKAKANLVIYVDSIGSDVLSSSQLKIAQQGQKIKINKVAYPQDIIASLTTLATGQTPSVHGIVNKAWKNDQGEFVAFSESASNKILNLNDLMTQTFEGEPLIITGSSNYQMSCAVGVNSKNYVGNNFNLFWNQWRNSFDGVHFRNTFGLNISKEQISEFQIPETFDSKEDFFFVAELAFVQNMIKQLENDHFKPLVNDKVPDLFSFSFASLKNIESNKFNTAIELFDNTLIEVINKLSTLYSGKIAVQVVFMGKTASQKLAEDQELKETIFSLIKEDVTKESFEAYFPSIYLTDSSRQQAVCTRIREEINNQVFCPDHSTAQSNINLFVTSLAATNGTTPTYEAATTFQTVLWMSIIMFLFVLAAVYAIGGIALEVVVDPWLQVRDTKEHQS